MIKKCICENLYVVMIYCKVQIYSKNDSNKCKTWWSTFSYIEYEVIVPFQLQLKSFTHVISQKTYGQVFHSNKHKCVEKKHFVEKLSSFESWQELCWRHLYQTSFYMFINTLDEIKENCTQNIPPKKYIFLPKMPPLVCFHPWDQDWSLLILKTHIAHSTHQLSIHDLLQ